ncbi:hypothetical protein CWR48_01450 [Oceanobacillus arenosus]|uniref:Polysaccharide pyruvyl transferase domain-containing protein n=1 Tax=Oceanobacillus arenosus TaxID=1229153 RepID=A0A3D8Q3I1_9BACI|nr:polysaccharide pyruvyl transferase family protein [Oceanobacillus arenosus]RDW22398.1 hypothetical protein CWR48_01450 [Oceanobacillus arenosus]
MRMLVNAYFAKNIGDDLFLKVLFDRYPDVEWYLLTSNKTYREIFSNYNNVVILRSLSVNFFGLRKVDVFSKINNLLNFWKYDGLVIIGGSIFMEGPDWKGFLTSKSILPDKLKKLNKKSFIIGANFGPFSDNDFVNSHKKYFSLFEDVCFRDFNSYSLFKDLKNIRVSTDAVFNLKKDDSNSIVMERSIGFSLINLEKREDLRNYNTVYNDKIVELVEYYSKLGFSINLFSFCEQEGDLSMCNNIKQRIGVEHKSKVKIINYNGNIDAFLVKYRSCDLIIGTRFHSIILALLYNINVFPIIYSNKTHNILNDLNLEGNGVFIKNMEKLKPENVIPIPNKIDIDKVCDEATNQFKALDLFVGKY